MESWTQELASHKGFTTPDSCPDHLRSFGLWTLSHRKGEQGGTVVCRGQGGPSEIVPKGLVLGRYVHPCIAELSL